MPGQALDVPMLKLMELDLPEPSREGDAPSKKKGTTVAAPSKEEEEEKDSEAEASDDDVRSPNLLRRGR